MVKVLAVQPVATTHGLPVTRVLAVREVLVELTALGENFLGVMALHWAVITAGAAGAQDQQRPKTIRITTSSVAAREEFDLSGVLAGHSHQLAQQIFKESHELIHKG